MRSGWAIAVLLAIELTSVAGRSDGSAGRVPFDRGVYLLGINDLTAAAAAFEDAIQRDPTLTEAYVKLGAVRMAQKRWADAVQILRGCPTQNDLDVREELGISLDKLGDSSAIPILERVVTDAPERFAARLALGLRYLRVKDPARSTDALERYLRSRPASASQIDTEVRERLAQGYLLLGRWQSAIREYEMVQKSKRDDVVVRIGLATALVGAGDCNRAVPLLEPIAATGAQPSAWYNLAKCYLSMGRKADAREMARRYTIAKPSDPKGQELAKQTAE